MTTAVDIDVRRIDSEHANLDNILHMSESYGDQC